VRKKPAFTIIELLTALAIISFLIGILMPSISYVRNKSKVTAQRAQLATIDMAILTFKADNGYYPPSESTSVDPQIFNAEQQAYCGAQKLCEALLGWDLLGFHPDTAWHEDGTDAAGGWWTYDPTKTRDADGDGPDTLDERVGPYLELATTKAFKLGDTQLGAGDGLYSDPTPLYANTYVLCDVFGVKKIKIGTAENQQVVKAGTPILYFRADTSKKQLSSGRGRSIYTVSDNITLLAKLKSIASGEKVSHPLGDATGYDTFNSYEKFYNYITDPRATSRISQITYMPWPYRADSYILITAGPDGLYGTDDDICNFTR